MIPHARQFGWLRLIVGFAIAFICVPAHAQEEDAIEACFSAYEETQVRLKSKEFEKARELSRQCSQGCPAEISEQCQKWTWQAERDAPSVILVARLESGEDVDDVKVSIDGDWRPLQKEVLLDPGPHTIVFSRDDGWTHSLDVKIHSGEKRRTIRASVPPEGQTDAPPPSKPEANNSHLPWAITSFSVGAVGFGVAGAFTVAALDRKAALDECAETTEGCPQSQIDDARMPLVIADIGLAVGVVGAATGLGILVWGKPKAASAAVDQPKHYASHAVLSVAPSPGGFSTVLRGTF